jgi:hypothetical protein
MNRAEAGRLGALKGIPTRAAINKKRVDEYERNPKHCGTCEKPIPYAKRRTTYCDHSCAARTNNQVGKRTIRYKGPRLCIMCGKQRNTGRKYCSECYKQKQNSRRGTWETVKTNRVARRLLIWEFGHRCFGCGLSQWLGKEMPLEIHHEDGNSENYKKGNIKLLCPNCHALTPTYRNRNKHASEQRRKRRKTKEFAL